VEFKKNKMHFSKSILIIFVALIMISIVFVNNFNISYGNVSPEAIEVSITDLIDNPQEYSGKLVRVHGVCRLQFEEDALYSSADDYKNHISANAIWLSLNDNGRQTFTYFLLKKASGRCVLVEGVFSKWNTGHWGAYPGAITQITRFQSL
jgi:hypothetical protein